jgi:hypothetical protein
MPLGSGSIVSVELLNFLGRDTPAVIPRVSSTVMVISMASLPSRARCRQPSIVSNAGVAADLRLFLGGSVSVARVTPVSFR